MKSYNRMAILAGTLAAGLMPAAGWARPITYPGGVNVMVSHEPMMDMTHIDYTLNKDWAIGWASTLYTDDGYSSHGPQVTRGWRWNYPDSQANLYVSGGAGSTFVDDDAHASAWGGTSIDWENRRWYTQAGTNFHTTEDGPDFVRSSARVGVAPYIAEAGGLHSWLMLQADHTPGREETWSVTPMLRQFWGSNLWEVGVNSRGGLLLNFTKTF